jgi:hypothetical protein
VTSVQSSDLVLDFDDECLFEDCLEDRDDIAEDSFSVSEPDSAVCLPRPFPDDLDDDDAWDTLARVLVEGPSYSSTFSVE